MYVHGANKGPSRKRRVLVAGIAAISLVSFGTVSVAGAHEKGGRDAKEASAEKGKSAEQSEYGKTRSQFAHDVIALRKATKSGDQAKIDAAIEKLKASSKALAAAEAAKKAKEGDKTDEKKDEKSDDDKSGKVKEGDKTTTSTTAPK